MRRLRVQSSGAHRPRGPGGAGCTDASPRLLLISGPRDSGKTRAAKGLAERWRRRGLHVGGILSVAGLRDGRKVFYTYVEVGTGKRMQYARHRPGPIPRGQPTYVLREEGLEFGRQAILKAVKADLHVLFVDEIGPREMERAGLWEALRQALTGFRGTIVLTVRPALVRRLRRLLGAIADGAQVLTPAQAAEME